MNKKLIIFIGAFMALMSTQAAIALEAGSKAPDCALTAIGDGQQKYSLNQYQGKVLYIDFWASWCVPCAKSFPFFNQLHTDLVGRGLQILAVNLDENSGDAQDFLAKLPVNFMVAADNDKQCANAFTVTAMPSSYLIDRKGVIRHVHLGFRPGEAEELQALLMTLLAEK